MSLCRGYLRNGRLTTIRTTHSIFSWYTALPDTPQETRTGPRSLWPLLWMLPQGLAQASLDNYSSRAAGGMPGSWRCSPKPCGKTLGCASWPRYCLTVFLCGVMLVRASAPRGCAHQEPRTALQESRRHPRSPRSSWLCFPRPGSSSGRLQSGPVPG